mgnify:CR=1 FL=1
MSDTNDRLPPLNALRAFDEHTGFRELIEADPDVTAALTPETIEHCFDDRAWLTHVQAVIARLERLDP